MKALSYRLLTWVAHLFISTVGVNISSVLIYGSFKPILMLFAPESFVRNNAILSVRFFPFQASVAFVCAWYLARKGGNFGTEPWVRLLWIVPFVWWLFLVTGWHHQSLVDDGRWQHFVWSRSREAFTIQAISTLPLITTLAYAFGNYCGANRVTRPSSQRTL